MAVLYCELLVARLRHGVIAQQWLSCWRWRQPLNGQMQTSSAG